MLKKMLYKIPGMQEEAEYIKEYPIQVMSTISPTIASKMVYKSRVKKELNLKSPLLFNEKLMWLKLHEYDGNALITECSDKYRARNYVKRCGLGTILNELHGVWKDCNDIQWDKLPNKFVLKCNHGCGYNIICDDRAAFNPDMAKRRLRRWMRQNFWKQAAELNYKNIPKRIICERYIGTDDNQLPADYKIYCFEGEPVFIGMYYNRVKETHVLQRGYFDFNWEPVPFMKPEYNGDATQCERPSVLSELYSVAKRLCSPFHFVRVDLYEYNRQIVFGELTFTPAFCTGQMFTNEGMLYLGGLINLE